jgi:hypothetical protein
MKKVYVFIGAIVVFCGVSAWLISTRAKQAPPPNAVSEPAPENAEASMRGDPEWKIQRLRAEVQKKDTIIREFNARMASPPVASGPAIPSHENVDPCDQLDERMYAAPVNSRESEQMKSQIQTAMNADLLGKVRIGSLECGSTICKMVLAAENNNDIREFTSKLPGQIPKTFAKLVAHTTKSGEKALYFATKEGDLSIRAPKEAEGTKNVAYVPNNNQGGGNSPGESMTR